MVPNTLTQAECDAAQRKVQGRQLTLGFVVPAGKKLNEVKLNNKQYYKNALEIVSEEKEEEKHNRILTAEEQERHILTALPNEQFPSTGGVCNICTFIY